VSYIAVLGQERGYDEFLRLDRDQDGLLDHKGCARLARQLLPSLRPREVGGAALDRCINRVQLRLHSKSSTLHRTVVVQIILVLHWLGGAAIVCVQDVPSSSRILLDVPYASESLAV
jgi:hypothetical protein